MDDFYITYIYIELYCVIIILLGAILEAGPGLGNSSEALLRRILRNSAAALGRHHPSGAAAEPPLGKHPEMKVDVGVPPNHPS